MYPQYSTMKRSSDPMISNLIDELKFSESPSLRLAFEDNRVCEKLKADEHEDGDQATNTPGQDYDEPAVTRRELYSYYLYSNATNGIGPSRFTMTLFQSLANSAGYDPVAGLGSSCNSPGSRSRCVIPFGAGERIRSVDSLTLIANGLSFAIMTIIYITFGGSADYGHFDKHMLLFLSCVWWFTQLELIGISDPSHWPAAMALYIVGFSAYGSALVFFSASFSRLSRNTPEALSAQQELRGGLISAEDYDQQLSLQKNRISLISSIHYNLGAFITLLISFAIVILHPNERHSKNWMIVISAGYSISVGVWWFLFQQKRPRMPLPRGKSYMTVGLWTLFKCIQTCRALPQTFVYLLASVLLADGVNTTTTLIYIIQGDVLAFDDVSLTFLNLAQAATSIGAVAVWWYIHKTYNFKTKKMFAVSTIATVAIPLWGTLGMFTDKIGFHNSWEFWAYNFIVAIFQTPYYAYAVTMMAELTPAGYENMFFCLYGFSNRAASLIGPSVIQEIINRTGSNWSGFPFMFISTLSAVFIIMLGVDVEVGREAATRWSNLQMDLASSHRAD